MHAHTDEEYQYLYTNDVSVFLSLDFSVIL